MSKTFSTPFSRDYWRLAAGEVKNVRMLVLAALLVALRVALKSVVIPVGENLLISLGFFVNALGAMVFGPVMALLAAAVSDTLGAIFFPTGAYFFPFIFVEMLGSLIFALFLYRARITAGRIILCRFAVSFCCNIILTPIIMYYYYLFVLGKTYSILSLPRVVKNLALFPAECVLLVLFLGLMVPLVNRMNFMDYVIPTDGIRLTKRHLAVIGVLFILSALCVAFYYGVYIAPSPELSLFGHVYHIPAWLQKG
ncbi:MAG: folate family ECF transporter S component [Clostridiales bacterium]|nr:folate family ECF transporter S component [Clostridiales bacterium]